MKVSRVLSTQHPDNARNPFFVNNSVIEGDDEIKEAFYAFSHLCCREQLWDYEGKEVDNFVVKKLLTNYEPYFRNHKLGKDIFLTLRVPNPDIEKNEAKVLLETLESIPRNFDSARVFYKEDIPPIFEVAVPMTKDHKVLLRIKRYYEHFVIGKKYSNIFNNDITISEWIGDFLPEKIQLIPLVEDKESILNSDKILENYFNEEKISEYQRVWLARSDPALNYGSLAAVLIVKIALQRLQDLQENISKEILPIIGCGSAPFRGNLKPTNVDQFLKGYPSIQTFTIQSAFKYDYEEKEVREAVEKIESSQRKKPIIIDEEKAINIIERLSFEYQKQIVLLAPIINKVAKYVPEKRRRKLHIGLFGYSRESQGIKLPRAIKFCASLYSLGFPPELLSLNVLTQKDIDFIQDIYPSFNNDLSDALSLLNKENLEFFPKEITKLLPLDIMEYETERKHNKITSIILDDLKKENTVSIGENIMRAAAIRGFLG